MNEAYKLGALQALYDAGLAKQAGLRAAWRGLKGLNTKAESMLSGKPAAVAEAANKIQIKSKGSPLRKATATAEDVNRRAEEFVRG